jgi:hypothetical protein
MFLKFKLLALAVLLPFATSCCAPKELFSTLDRHCFLPDWMNQHSCVNRACYTGHQRSHHRPADCPTYGPLFDEPTAAPDAILAQPDAVIEQ